MAEFNSTTFGKISGKHGTAVACIRGNKNYLRVHTKPKDKKSEKQLEQRARFGLASKTVNRFSEVFEDTYPTERARSSARSLAFRSIITGEMPNLSVDFSKLKLSSGTLQTSQFVEMGYTEDAKVTLKWYSQALTEENSYDTLNLVFYCESFDSLVHLKDVGFRAEEQVNVELPEVFLEQISYVWGYYRNGNKSSPSFHSKIPF